MAEEKQDFQNRDDSVDRQVPGEPIRLANEVLKSRFPDSGKASIPEGQNENKSEDSQS